MPSSKPQKIYLLKPTAYANMEITIRLSTKQETNLVKASNIDLVTNHIEELKGEAHYDIIDMLRNIVHDHDSSGCRDKFCKSLRVLHRLYRREIGQHAIAGAMKDVRAWDKVNRLDRGSGCVAKLGGTVAHKIGDTNKPGLAGDYDNPKFRDYLGMACESDEGDVSEKGEEGDVINSAESDEGEDIDGSEGSEVNGDGEEASSGTEEM